MIQAQSKELIKQYLKSYMRNENFSLEIQEVQALIFSIHALVMRDVRENNDGIYQEIRELSSFVESYKEDICSLFMDDVKTSTMDVLDVVLKTTEEAVEGILECAEEIDDLALGAPDDMAERLSGLSTRIYEASNFQDLNGQRIIKVIRALTTMEEKVAGVMDKIGVDESDRQKALQEREKAEEQKSENELLMNGPQTPGGGVSQDEIDRLLEGL